MPKANPISRPPADTQIYLVNKNGAETQAHILSHREGEVYVHYVNTDKRLDEWIPESDFISFETRVMDEDGPSRKRKRGSPRRASAAAQEQDLAVIANHSGVVPDGITPEESAMTEEEYDIQHHKQITAQRNFDKVIFGHWQIKTWYFSPYPLTEAEIDESSASSSHAAASTSTLPPTARIPGVNRATLRSHGRTSDLLAGGLGRTHGLGEHSVLWVCDRCFKYMADGAAWELHVRTCTRKHPPGTKVYQRGAHTIWEVDGAKEKLYCQNLSLFGKLFIDVKTLFFDCDNFLFYLLTDADSQRDHVIGYFSKEKVSYDDYNLACIITLPPYQRKGYGMLMIEFSYELSRRAGKVGTPERPLSDLGLRSYLTYWVSTIVRFLRRLLSVVPPETSHIISTGPTLDLSVLRSPSRDLDDSSHPLPMKRKRTKGWDGEMTDPSVATAPASTMDDPLVTSMRTVETSANPDGSATSHVVVRCTLTDIARATNLRVEDVAFALNECGLLKRRRRKTGDSAVEAMVVVSREMVEVVARERGVKKMCMELPHVLL